MQQRDICRSEDEILTQIISQTQVHVVYQTLQEKPLLPLKTAFTLPLELNAKPLVLGLVAP